MNNKNFTENDIRPVVLMDKQRIAMLMDIGRLLTRYKEFISINCPACGSSSFYKKLEKYGFTFVSCRDCETIYMNPRPTQDILEWFYKNSENYEYWNKYIFPASENIRRQKIFKPRVERILEICDKYNINTNSLMEIGAAFGTFCSEMILKNRFKHVIGVEPTPELAKTCRQKGITIIENTIENVVLDDQIGKFDVIVGFEVIEHLFSPKALLQNCEKMLNNNGLLVISCPNSQGFDFIVLGSLCDAIDHEHLNYFNTTSLALLIRSCGFEILEIQTPGMLDAELVRKKILNGEYDISQQHFLKKLLIDDWEKHGKGFQKYLSDSCLSSHLWMVARKKQ